MQLPSFLKPSLAILGCLVATWMAGAGCVAETAALETASLGSVDFQSERQEITWTLHWWGRNGDTDLYVCSCYERLLCYPTNQCGGAPAAFTAATCDAQLLEWSEDLDAQCESYCETDQACQAFDCTTAEDCSAGSGSGSGTGTGSGTGP